MVERRAREQRRAETRSVPRTSNSTAESIKNDGTRECVQCNEKKSNGITCDTCSNGHFVCEDCVNEHVKTEIRKGDDYMRYANDGKICCPVELRGGMFFRRRCEFEYTPVLLRRHIDSETFKILMHYIERKAYKEGVAEQVRLRRLEGTPENEQSDTRNVGPFKPCPTCGFTVQLRRGHGSHDINGRDGCLTCGTQWCYSCGQKCGGVDDDCECNPYCDENCDCPPCEDCALDTPCEFCDGDCPVCMPDHDRSTSNETLTSSVNSQTVPSTSSLEEETDAITQYDIDTLKRKFKRRELLEKCKSLNIKGVSNKNKHQIAARLSEYIEALKDDASAMNFLDLVLDNMRRVDLLEVIQNCPNIDQKGIVSKNRQELVDIIRDNTSATLFVLRQNVNPIDLSRIGTIFTRADLLKQCKALNIRGVSNKTKAEIIARIQEYQEALLGNDWEGEFLTLLLKNMTKAEMIEVLEQCSDINIKGLGSKNRDELLKLVQGNPKASLRIVRQNVDPIIPN